ncbi:MAG: tyrosine-type recombinase/integrase, partial [Pseudomonadales bacterium]
MPKQADAKANADADAKAKARASANADANLIEKFLDSLWLEKGLSDNTLKAYRNDLQHFAAWIKQHRGDLTKASRTQVLNYLSDRMGQGIKARSTARSLSCLRAFYRYLLREKLLTTDPTLRVENPKLGRRLPTSLTEKDVEKLLAAPDLNTPVGYRDRTMLEVLYACGLRVSELTGLRLAEINLRQGVVRVLGKGSKERLVPMGEEAINWVQKYMDEARPTLLKGNLAQDIIFPSNRGAPMTRQAFW